MRTLRNPKGIAGLRVYWGGSFGKEGAARDVRHVQGFLRVNIEGQSAPE